MLVQIGIQSMIINSVYLYKTGKQFKFLRKLKKSKSIDSGISRESRKKQVGDKVVKYKIEIDSGGVGYGEIIWYYYFFLEILNPIFFLGFRSLFFSSSSSLHLKTNSMFLVLLWVFLINFSMAKRSSVLAYSLVSFVS